MPAQQLPTFDSSILSQLACPVCHGELRLIASQLVCKSCLHSYLIQDGIPALIPAHLNF
jgi:uncharacterized protein YbaR (Trm112 family)